jgi:uncharacterized membrane protein YhaH (DUF805 family)
MENNQIKFLSVDDMFGIKGRMGRLHYMLVTVRIFVLGMALIALIPPAIFIVSFVGVNPLFAQNIFIALILIGLSLSNLSIVMRRVQDIGFPYWTVFIMILLSFLVPHEPEWLVLAATIVVFAMQIALFIIPGDAEKNAYGACVENPEMPEEYYWMKPSTQGIAVFGSVLLVAFLFMLAFAQYIPEEYLPENISTESYTLNSQ